MEISLDDIFKPGSSKFMMHAEWFISLTLPDFFFSFVLGLGFPYPNTKGKKRGLAT